MSARATGAVWDHAEYSGARLLVLLALADVANDAHENELWMRHAALARKARVHGNTAREAVDVFVADGWLEEVEAAVGRKAGRYRFTGPPLTRLGRDNDEGLSRPTRDPDAPVARQPGPAPLTGNSKSNDAATTSAPKPAGRANQADADRISREWWESHDPRPLGSFPGLRKIVEEALDRGHPSARVAVALRRCGRAVPSRPVLARELDRGNPPPPPTEAPRDGFDNQPPEGGRVW